MASDQPSTQTIAVILIIVALAILLPFLYLKSRMNKRNARIPVFGTFRSISNGQQILPMRPTAPARLQQVTVEIPPGSDNASISNCSILPRYEVDKSPPAYIEDTGACDLEHERTRTNSVDLSDMMVRYQIDSRSGRD
jgi:hypothetical protein